MGSVKEYFSSLGTGIASLVKGLTVTGKEFVTPKITECYPENRDQGVAAERFRAELHFVYNEDGTHRCICCSACERACPNGTIRIEPKMVTTATGAKKRNLPSISTTWVAVLSASCALQTVPHRLLLSTTISSRLFSPVENL